MDDPEWEEYKILQGKIDRIADFRFRIKGWAVTIVLALLASGYIAKLPWYAYLAYLLVVLMFYMLERPQDLWHKAFVARLIEIERILGIKKAKADKEDDNFVSFKRSAVPQISLSLSKVKHKGRVRSAFLRFHHGGFYLFMVLLIVLTVLLSTCNSDGGVGKTGSQPLSVFNSLTKTSAGSMVMGWRTSDTEVKKEQTIESISKGNFSHG